MPTHTFERLKDEKQESVIRSAIHEFVLHGFARAKISDIAKGAGIAKGSIFQYFEDKRELFIYSSQWGLKLFMKKISERMNVGEMDVFEYFQDTSPVSQLLVEENELVRFMDIVMNEPGLVDDSYKGMYDVSRVYTTTLIQNGKRKGTIRTDVDDEVLLEYFLGVTDRFSKRWFRLYIDLSTGTVSQADALNKERGHMLDMLKEGMGC